MGTEAIKQNLIDRLSSMSPAALRRMEELVRQAEFEQRALESLQAAEDGQVVSLEEFSKQSAEWKRQHIK
ncbi:MAG: hypothetical protein RIF46_12440 [Cyclobacteriaceae bacterium]